jgi:hypothetical protein
MAAFATGVLAVVMASSPTLVILGGGYLLGWAIRRGWSDAAYAETEVRREGGLLSTAMSVRAPWWVIAGLALAVIAVLMPVVLALPAR